MKTTTQAPTPNPALLNGVDGRSISQPADISPRSAESNRPAPGRRKGPSRQPSLVDLMQKLLRLLKGRKTNSSPQIPAQSYALAPSPTNNQRGASAAQLSVTASDTTDSGSATSNPTDVDSRAVFNFATLVTPLHNTDALHQVLRTVLAAQPTGLQAEHLQTMLGLCRAFNLIIGIRPVSKHASYLLGPLEYPTKPMAIKAKTARIGPAAGHVLAPVQGADRGEPSPAAEPAENTGTTVTTEQGRTSNHPPPTSEMTRQKPDDTHAVVLPLMLTGERINMLLRDNVLLSYRENPPITDESDNRHADTLHVRCKASGQAFVLRRQSAEQSGYLRSSLSRGGAWAVFALPGHGNEPDTAREQPVYVLGHPRLKKPYTADYDLLTFGLHQPDSQSIVQSLPPIPLERSLDELISARRSLSLHSGKEGQSLAANRSMSEDAVWGNASPFFRCLAESINACINRGGDIALQLIHHNADCHNPYSSERSIYPALFLLPNPAALPLSDILPHAREDTPVLLERLRSLNSSQTSQQPDIDWNNWGAVWVKNHIQFTRLASTAHRHGYVIKKSQAWLGGEILHASNSAAGIR